MQFSHPSASHFERSRARTCKFGDLRLAAASNSGSLSPTGGRPGPPRLPEQSIPTWTIAWARQPRPSAIAELTAEPKPLVTATLLANRLRVSSPSSGSWTWQRLILPTEQRVPFSLPLRASNLEYLEGSESCDVHAAHCI